MAIGRHRLYWLLFILCIAGYIWLYIWLLTGGSKPDASEVCIIRYVTGVPCPSCGSTRSAYSLLSGDLLSAIYINPLGIVVLGIMVLAPLWIVFDLLWKRQSLYRFYLDIEDKLRKPVVAIPLILLIIINWIWNIIKGI